MKQVPIIHSGHSQLLLFFTGWAADETPFAHYRPNDMDYAVCYDYRTQAWDTTFLNGYQEINIVAWSMGVWMVNQLYGTLSALPIRHCIAINGTPYPMDDRRGIPVDIFRGTLENLTPASLHNFGFTNVIMVKEQSVLDGNFPTVASPNPEERKTMKMAIELAEREQADLAMATDPDSDRIGVALRTGKGEYVLLNGNQTLILLMCYQLTRWAELGRIKDGDYVVKTIVTSTMPDAVAAYYGVKCYNCLTGFKYIAKIIREHEGKAKYIGGGEESFGYLAGDYVRDKDGVSACSLVAEAAAWCRDTKGMTLYEWLQDLYVKFGFYREGLVNVVRKGKDGAELIQNMMVEYRNNPPARRW